MTPIYQPYPYFTDTLFQRDLSALLAQLPPDDNSQILLMTHDGPHFSATTIDKTTRLKERKDILFGSEYLYNTLREDGGKRFVANIHGHAHDGAPCDKITDNIRVLNPGSLKYGEFAQLTLAKDPSNGRWKVYEYNKHFL